MIKKKPRQEILPLFCDSFEDQGQFPDRLGTNKNAIKTLEILRTKINLLGLLNASPPEQVKIITSFIEQIL